MGLANQPDFVNACALVETTLAPRTLLAKLLAQQGKLDEAMTVVTEGIASASRESFFVANLYTVKGEIHEARAAAETDKDRPFLAGPAVASAAESGRSTAIRE